MYEIALFVVAIRIQLFGVINPKLLKVFGILALALRREAMLRVLGIATVEQTFFSKMV